MSSKFWRRGLRIQDEGLVLSFTDFDTKYYMYAERYPFNGA